MTAPDTPSLTAQIEARMATGEPFTSDDLKALGPADNDYFLGRIDFLDGKPAGETMECQRCAGEGCEP